MDIDYRNYWLRLGLTELSKPFLGSWLCLDGTNPNSSPFPFEPPTPCSLVLPVLPSPARLGSWESHSAQFSNTNGSHTIIAPAVAQEWPTLGTKSSSLRIQGEFRNGDNFHYHGGQVQELGCWSKIEISDLWLRAGSYCKGPPRQLNWVATHMREEMFGTSSSFSITDKTELRSRKKEDSDPVSNSSSAGNGQLRSTQFFSDSIQESDLVRAALCALQGVSTAVRWLEQLAAAFSSTAADSSSQNFTTLWTRASSSYALSKVLTEFAKAGRVACQLDSFTSFFLNHQSDPYMDGISETHNSCVRVSSRKKRKRQHFTTESNTQRTSGTSSEIWKDVMGPDTSPRCHINQAFAAAVKTFMQGNIASLDTMGSSVKHRRQTVSSGLSVELSEVVNRDAGLVFGFDCGDFTLLELFLHSHKQREQLQALAALCRIDEGASLERSSADMVEEVIGVRVVTENVDMKGFALEMETHSVRRPFKEFPRGADLLTYLFDKLLEADTPNLELLRFLFERACEPYTVLIRSWLYLATVQDPFGEFFVKEAPQTWGDTWRNSSKCSRETHKQDAPLSDQVSNEVTVPCFLEEVCTPLLRAGQQLQVLSKILNNRQCASKIGDSPFKLSNRLQDTLLSFSCSSDILINKSTFNGPVLLFSKKGTNGAVQECKGSSQMLKGFHEVSHAGLANSPLPQHEMKGSEVKKGAVLANGFWLSGVEDLTQQHARTMTKIQGGNVKSCQESMARAAVLKAETVDGIPVASVSRPGSLLSLLQSPVSLTDEKKVGYVGKCLKSRSLTQVDLLNFEMDMSFISDFQRGTSWSILGLPKNPFLPFTNRRDQCLLLFPVCDSCWDVNIHWGDLYCVTDTRSQFLKVAHDWPISGWRFSLDNQKVEFDHLLWFKNLGDSFTEQLTLGLEKHNLQADYGSLECEFERENGYWNAYILGCQTWGCSMRLLNPNASPQQNAGGHLQANARWKLVDSSMVDSLEKRNVVDNCLLRRNLRVVESTSPLLYSDLVDIYEKHNILSRTDVLEVQDGKSRIPLEMDVWDSNFLPGAVPSGLDEIEQTTDVQGEQIISGVTPVGSGTKWETYQRHEYLQLVDVGLHQHPPLRQVDEVIDEEIPLSVAVKLCIVEEILYQYKCTSMLTIRLLEESLHLQDHFTALRRYYFMERGDWAEYFLSALCKYEWNQLGGELQQLEVQNMLRTALQSSSCEGDEFAERLYVVSCTYDGRHSALHNPLLAFSEHQHSIGTVVNCNKLEVFDFIKMGYKVEWPLCLIITPSAQSRYSSIFTFLLRMKLTIFALADIWRNLQIVSYSLNKGRQNLHHQGHNKKFCTLQLFRQQIEHVMMTFQRYIELQLVHVVWNKFLNSLGDEVNDIQYLEQLHSVYLDDAYHQCFLSRDMEDAKTCIDIIMQCTLDFRALLLTAKDEHSGNLEPVNDTVFHKVLEVKTIFEVHLHKLYSYHQRPEYSTLLADFWMCLNYNGCLRSACLSTI